MVRERVAQLTAIVRAPCVRASPHARAPPLLPGCPLHRRSRHPRIFTVQTVATRTHSDFFIGFFVFVFLCVCVVFFSIFFFFIKSQRPKCNRSSKITVRSAIADRPSVYRAPDRSSGHWPLRKIDSVSDSRTEKIKSNSGSGEGMILDGRKFSRDIRPPAVPLRISCSNFSCHGRSVRIVLTTVCQWNF